MRFPIDTTNSVYEKNTKVYETGDDPEVDWIADLANALIDHEGRDAFPKVWRRVYTTMLGMALARGEYQHFNYGVNQFNNIDWSTVHEKYKDDPSKGFFGGHYFGPCIPNYFDVYCWYPESPELISFQWEHYLSEYLKNAFDRLKVNGYPLKYIPEYETKFGRCDYKVSSLSDEFLLELKPKPLQLKDVYQALGYKIAEDVPVYLMGPAISFDVLNLAKESNVNVCIYKINKKLVPTSVSFKILTGRETDIFDDIDSTPYYYFGWEEMMDQARIDFIPKKED